MGSDRRHQTTDTAAANSPRLYAVEVYGATWTVRATVTLTVCTRWTHTEDDRAEIHALDGLPVTFLTPSEIRPIERAVIAAERARRVGEVQS